MQTVFASLLYYFSRLLYRPFTQSDSFTIPKINHNINKKLDLKNEKHMVVVIVRSQYLSTPCKHARLPGKIAGHLHNFIILQKIYEAWFLGQKFHNSSLWLSFPHDQKTLYKWFLNMNILGARFTALEDSPRSVPIKALVLNRAPTSQCLNCLSY